MKIKEVFILFCLFLPACITNNTYNFNNKSTSNLFASAILPTVKVNNNSGTGVVIKIVKGELKDKVYKYISRGVVKGNNCHDYVSKQYSRKNIKSHLTLTNAVSTIDIAKLYIPKNIPLNNILCFKDKNNKRVQSGYIPLYLLFFEHVLGSQQIYQVHHVLVYEV